jgi:DNA-binding beta-propeller fold protein YncE
MKRFVWLGFVLFLYLICSGCGDTFRPIIIPNPPVFPNPEAAHTVVSINANAPPAGQAEVAAGTAMVIDVSGDTDVSVANVGLAPVHAVQQTSAQILVVNHSVSGPLNVGDSLTKLTFSSVTIGSVTTISLPPNSAPNFVASAPSATTAYVTLPNYSPPSVGVVSTASNTLILPFITVGSNPDALAVTPDNTKLYVANQGDGTVDGFNTLDRSARTINPPGSFNGPLWLTARNDSQRVYVLNGNGVVSTIDTTSTAGPDNVIDASVNVPGAAYMVYDQNLNRLYIPWGTQVTMLDVSQSIPSLITGAPIAIPTVPPSSRAATDPCSSTSAQTLTVAAVAALPDGSRAYVGAYYEDGSGNFCPQVTVINVVSNSIKTSIAVPGFPDATIVGSLYYVPACATTRFRIMMAAGGDSSRAYLSSCDGGMVNIIDTSSDTYALNLPAPVGVRLPIPPDPLNPPQNPVFLFAGP